jgi:hypothetical protein
MLLNLIFCLFLFGVYFIVLRIEFSLRKKINFFLKFEWVSALGLLMVFVAPFLFIFSVKNSVIAANFFQNMYELFFQNLFLGFERILSKYQQSSGDIERELNCLEQRWDTLYFIAYLFFGRFYFLLFSFIRM